MKIKVNNYAWVTIVLTVIIYGLFISYSVLELVFCLLYMSFMMGIAWFILFFLPCKKITKLRHDISREREIICEGFVNYKNRRGYLFLTKSALEFYYQKKNSNLNNFYVLLDDINKVYEDGNWVIGKKLVIVSKHEQVLFAVPKPAVWKRYIEDAIQK